MNPEPTGQHRGTGGSHLAPVTSMVSRNLPSTRWLDRAGMRFHRTSNTLRALLTVKAVSHTSFPAHDLGVYARPAHPVPRAEKFSEGGSGTRCFHSREPRRRLLPFA